MIVSTQANALSEIQLTSKTVGARAICQSTSHTWYHDKWAMSNVRHGDGTQGAHGRYMADSVAQRYKGEGLDTLGGHDRLFAELDGPQCDAVDDAECQLRPRNKPREGEPVQHPLVGDVVTL